MRRLLALAAATVLLGCSDDPVAPNNEPAVQSMRLQVGSSVVTIDRATGAPSGELSVPLGDSDIAVQWLRANNTEESLITDDEFEFRMTSTATSNFSFESTGARGGTITVTGVNSGEAITASVSLFHLDEGHADFGPYTITLRVQ